VKAGGSVVVLPWPCPGCGDGHLRKRTYYFAPDWYVCGCGQTVEARRVLELHDAKRRPEGRPQTQDRSPRPLPPDSIGEGTA
jgi:hypothetical protein